MEDLKRLLNHVVLPPMLPSQQDPDIHSLGYALSSRLMDACKKLQDATAEEFREGWTTLQTSLQAFRVVNTETIHQPSLSTAFQTLLQKENQVLVCNIAQQNAALLMYRQNDGTNDSIVFEAFEASPHSREVLAAPNALQWVFPSRAVQIPAKDFECPNFQSSLSAFLDKASSENLALLAAKSKKAGVSLQEVRNPGSPALITEMLMTVLEAMGDCATVDVLKKRVRDDVCFGDGGKPWRRLPLWLVLRVFSQRQLHLSFGKAVGNTAYKLLIGGLLAKMLDDAVQQRMDPAVIDMAKKKLCRRLAKLAASDTENSLHERLLKDTEDLFQKSIDAADHYVQKTVSDFRYSTIRQVDLLPRRISQSNSFTLSLPSSKHYLKSLRAPMPYHEATYAGETSMGNIDGLGPRRIDKGICKMEEFGSQWLAIAPLLSLARTKACGTRQRIRGAGESEISRRLLDVSRNIDVLLGHCTVLNNTTPELNSSLLLEIFGLWIAMDAAAISLFPMLREYAPVFPEELLDVLQLPSSRDMAYLREIQKYLHDRHVLSTGLTVFSPLDKDCFGKRYAEKCLTMRSTLKRIRDIQEKRRAQKREELTRLSEHYDHLTMEMQRRFCRCTVNPDGSRNIHGCDRCYYWRQQKSMRIGVCQDILPRDPSIASAVVFELHLPTLFSTYRDTTWNVLKTVAYPSLPAVAEEVKKLSEHTDLFQGMPPRLDQSNIILGSLVKAVGQTHYEQQPMKAEFRALIVPLTSRFEFFDRESKFRLSDFAERATLVHWCRIHIPKALTVTVLPEMAHPPPRLDGPSSYEAVSHRPRCPSDMSAHEFEAYERLLSGRKRRWMTMLVELGSSNLNFSKADTMLTISNLAHQAGPFEGADTAGHQATLGECHAVFSDDSFVQKLIQEIDSRMSAIQENWHETNSMGLLVTLALRVYALASDDTRRQEAMDLLYSARTITLRWIDILSSILHAAKTGVDGDAVQQASVYAFRAALLCRQTMSIFLARDVPFSKRDVSDYIIASVSLHKGLVMDADTLSDTDKNMLYRDIMMGKSLKSTIWDAISSYPSIVNQSIAYSIGLCAKPVLADETEEKTSLGFTPWQLCSNGSGDWMTAEILGDSRSQAQRIHFSYTQGHILVDGMAVGRLPMEIRDSDDVRELFHSQHLLTYPSRMRGMSHRLAAKHKDHEINFGMRNGHVLIVAVKESIRKFGHSFIYRRTEYEYVPRRIFIDSMGSSDLPRTLVDNCVHWYNRSKRVVEFRKLRDMWKYKKSQWELNIATYQVQRKKVLLVDPHSPIARKIARIFCDFEDPERLTIFQPLKLKGSLSVEMLHLDLSFNVNDRGLLESGQLCAEIDTNQDAGTLYGYRSMIVLRDLNDRGRRSIIAPLGRLQCCRVGPCTSVWTEIGAGRKVWGRYNGPQKMETSDKAYARFWIEADLQRLKCPPEPRLLYTKAQLHAFTSCPVADILTGRTGQEEAIHTLTSGCCQPWEPLDMESKEILNQMMSLAPKRCYYPLDMRELQQVAWNPDMSTGLQHDRYGRVIRKILEKSRNLEYFKDQSDETPRMQMKNTARGSTDSHALELRGEIQRLRYERPQMDSAAHFAIQNNDMKYESRGCKSGSSHNEWSPVFQITKIIRDKCHTFPLGRSYPDILNGWKLIGGHGTAADMRLISISTLLDTNTLGERWGSLVELCRNTPMNKETDIIFTLATMAFAPTIDFDFVCVLAAYFLLPALKTLDTPAHAIFCNFRHNEVPSQDSLAALMKPAFFEYRSDDHAAFGWARGRSEYKREILQHETKCTEDAHKLAGLVMRQWPDHDQPSDGGFTSDYVNVPKAMKGIIPEWERLRQNRDLSSYAEAVQSVLRLYRTAPRADSLGLRVAGNARGTVRELVPAPQADIVRKLLSRDMPRLPNLSLTVKSPQTEEASTREDVPSYTLAAECAELGGIVSSFSNSSAPLRQTYGRDLANSLAALERFEKRRHEERSQSATTLPTSQDLARNIEAVASKVAETLQHIHRNLSEGRVSSLLRQAGLWLPMTPVSTLELMRSTANYKYGPSTREVLASYACEMTRLQRLRRVHRWLMKRDQPRAAEEWRERGHENWNPLEHMDWLLFEIDSDLLIRAEQVEVAREIISPQSDTNSVLQLNMGRGKTSCIVPMVIATLANGQQLARLIVPKALLLPTAQILQARLGGLVGRELRHVAFSRRLTTGGMAEAVLGIFKEHHEDLKRQCGVLLAAPEHILAFKLSGFQCLADAKSEIGREMVSFQAYLTNTCRDILDESDFTLAVRTQLVYPSGILTDVDGAPYRWKLAESLLSIVEDSLPELCSRFPNSIQTVERLGGFPMVYILQASDVERGLRECIVRAIRDGRMSLFRPSANKVRRVYYSSDEVLASLEKALRADSNEKAIKSAAAMFPDEQTVANGLMLIHGLLAHGVLLMCLKKRWNVEYGLHPRRWPIAVPFEAKGVPSERSEFGHPDVAIIFTCLSFYYSGLSMPQFVDGLKRILQHSDDPATEYEQWTAGASNLDDNLRNWYSINVDDSAQMEKLWQRLRLTRPTIDHYLNTFVFPFHAKQFSNKLQASAWDLPNFPAATPHASTSGARTTGFSGTNDNKMMLPLTIKQQDLPSLQQTNAEVLAYLLQARNRNYVRTGSLSNGQVQRWTERQIVENLHKHKTRVFIDAGAYILEKSNESFAREWLDVDWEAKAAVFFGENDNRAWVLFRDATIKKAPLVTTPFVDRLDKCLIYFDEAHTRGVDLVLPPHTRGVLTLALGQTKDHTVQAAMRLRQLGTTQSVVFYAPPEVDASIRDVCHQMGMPIDSRKSQRGIDSHHVILWLLEQTCLANEQLHSLYLSHGRDFCNRMDAQWKNEANLAKDRSRTALLQVIRQPERQTLAQMYGYEQASSAAKAKNARKFKLAELQAFSEELDAQEKGNVSKRRMRKAGLFGVQEVEQEREVETQVEQVRAKQRRTRFPALAFPGVHASIRTFVLTGELRAYGQVRLKTETCGFKQAYASIAETRIGMQHGMTTTWPSRLFVSEEFDRTINTDESLQPGRRDNFLRPVEWVIWSPSTETALVVIPEEMEELLPAIRTLGRVHLLAYAAPVTRAMAAFSSLTYYAVPALPSHYRLPEWLVIELGILAGRLYMTYSEAVAMAEYLDPTSPETASRGEFCRNPMTFLLEWLPMRRVGQEILHTPIGYICQGRPLNKDHPFFVQSTESTEVTTSSGDEESSRSEVDSDTSVEDSEDSEDGEDGEDECDDTSM